MKLTRTTMATTAAAVDDNNVNDDNLMLHVGKRNDDCHKTKTEEEETVADSVADTHINQTDHGEGG